MTNIYQDITKNIGSLFTCTVAAHGYVRIETPFMYSDRDIIDLFYKVQESGEIILTDLGETTQWLRMQSTSQKRSEKQNLLIEDICQTHGTEMYRGMLTIRSSSQRLMDDISQLAQACIRVADLWLLERSDCLESMKDEVAVFLEANEIRYNQRVPIIGQSGRKRLIDFLTIDPKQNSLIYILSVQNRPSANRRMDVVAASLLDVSENKDLSDYRFICLVDDRLDVWDKNNFNMLNKLSTVTYWSRPDEFLELLISKSKEIKT
jgi:hypothetical protein